jgi:hypothetical protein
MFIKIEYKLKSKHAFILAIYTKKQAVKTPILQPVFKQLFYFKTTLLFVNKTLQTLLLKG